MEKRKSFALGYSFVVHSFLSYLVMAFVIVSFSNVVFPGFIEKYGWDPTVLATLNTVGSIVGALVGLPLGVWVEKKGPKQVLIIGFIVGGINMILFAFASTIALFSVSLFLSHICAQAYCQMTTNNLIAHWFVKRKGAILGITTAGLPASHAIFLPIYSAIAMRNGMLAGLSFVGIFMIAMGILSIFWVKNTPQEVGLTPDNLPVENEEDRKAFAEKLYTFRQLLSNKFTWLLFAVFGLMFCATIASSAQIVPYLMQHGFDQPGAVAVIGIAALTGILGSFVFGLIDQKFGTKNAIILYFIVAAIVFILMFTVHNQTATAVFAALAFALNGAPGNLLPSLLISMYGPEAFNSLFKLIMPVVAVIRGSGYVVAAAFALIFAQGMAAGIFMGLFIFMIAGLLLTFLIPKKKVVLGETEEAVSNA